MDIIIKAIVIVASLSSNYMVTVSKFETQIVPHILLTSQTTYSSRYDLFFFLVQRVKEKEVG